MTTCNTGGSVMVMIVTDPPVQNTGERSGTGVSDPERDALGWKGWIHNRQGYTEERRATRMKEHAPTNTHTHTHTRAHTHPPIIPHAHTHEHMHTHTHTHTYGHIRTDLERHGERGQ